MNPYESFSHSLVASKIWLCEKLETCIDIEHIHNPLVNILASWDSLLAFMLVVRRPNFYGSFYTYDIDKESVYRAEKICDHWKFEYPKMYHKVADINELNFSNAGNESVFINCSVDQVIGKKWYDSIPKGTIVCLQCTDLPINHKEWLITQSYNLQDFMLAYPMSKYLVTETKKISYTHLSFNRNMLIGIK